MSRIAISNNINVFNELVERNLECGLTLSCNIESEGVYFASFYKRVKKVVNYYMEGDNFILSSGTFVYKGKTGEEGLSLILNDYRLGNDFEKEIKGNFTIALSIDDHMRVICDHYSIHDLFYFTENDNTFAVCNSLSELAKVKNIKKINKSSLISETILSGYIGNESFIQGIYKLRGMEIIELSKSKLKVKITPQENLKFDLCNKSIEQAADMYCDMLQKHVKDIVNIWGDIAVHQTGGMDNRLIFSALVNQGSRPNLLYGRGNSILTTTNKEDLDCVLNYANRFSLPYQIMNWSHEASDSKPESWHNLYNRYGFKYAIYGAPQNFFDQYEGSIEHYPEFFEFGYYGENLRLREYLKNKDGVSIDEFFNSYLFGGGGGYGDLNNIDFLPDSNSIKSKLRKEFIFEAQLNGIELDEYIDANDFDKIRWIHARRADSRSVNLINEFAPSFATLSTPELHQFPWSLPREWKEGAKFQLMVIDKLCSKALDVPIFSHGNPQVLNRNTFKLEKQITWQHKVKNALTSFGVNNNVLKVLTRLYFKYLETDNSKAELGMNNIQSKEETFRVLVDYLDNTCPDDLKYINASHYPGHIVGLYRYFLHVQALEKLDLDSNS
ncbi:hypothetical protein [Vibrio cyclitrophicus]|uniref:hypothetical protein n=1 Tax=Vibrio cyclitrophicus TaxID=47951 RepID=UPI0002E2D366|nr:hypothetical protein [Vibrio cyclitrophicus]OCH57488.1 hypothetical protein A6D96_02240 [Vibrio cyclitrophicus]